MRFKEKERFYELPIEGNKVHKIAYGGVLRVFFDDLAESYLDLIGNLDLIGKFTVNQHGVSRSLNPASKEALLFFYDLVNTEGFIKTATADKEGRLYLLFTNNAEVTVEGSSEYWHFTRVSQQNPHSNVSISGGLGYLDF